MSPGIALLRQFKQRARASQLAFARNSGTRVRSTPFGQIVRFSGGSANFSHPWLPTLSGNGCTFQQGHVNNFPATIKGVPLDGDDSNPQPILELPNPLMLDTSNRGFLCVEVTCDPAHDWSIIKAEMVQVANPDAEDGSGDVYNPTGAAKPLKNNRARWPVALLRQRADDRIDIYEPVHFDLTHRVKFFPDNTTPQRHFFY